jgi:hypothetical protein
MQRTLYESPTESDKNMAATVEAGVPLHAPPERVRERAHVPSLHVRRRPPLPLASLAVYIHISL